MMCGKQIRRRDFIKGTAVGVAGLALGARSRRTFGIVNAEQRPNILVIMSDEHNPMVSGCYGSRVARTYHVDSLAEKGITFDAAYCNSPLCVPSRASFTSGKYCSRVRVWG